MAREFVWVTVKNRSTGALSSFGFYNDVMDVTVSVVDGRTGATVSRAFRGLANGLKVGKVPLTADITVRPTEIDLPHLDDGVVQIIRTYDIRNAPIQIYRGLYDTTTQALVANPKAHFVGYVDGAPIVTPREGDEGTVTLRCVSTTRELTRTNSEVRSHESQLSRTAGADDFYIDVDGVGDWEMSWGTEKKSVKAATSGKGND